MSTMFEELPGPEQMPGPDPLALPSSERPEPADARSCRLPRQGGASCGPVRAVVGTAGRARVITLRARSYGHDRGMATAEYAVATVAACGFGAALAGILRSDQVRALLTGIIRRALSV